MSTIKKKATAEDLTTAGGAFEDATRKLDPTTFAVVFNALNAIVKEMSLTFEYSAWSSIIAEARDFSCAVYDAEIPPNALCVFDGLPIHVNAQPVAIGEIAKFFGPEELHDGDLILVNSAYYGNTHLGDFVLATPVFYKGEHLFWAAATGHHMDVGSAYRTSVPIPSGPLGENDIERMANSFHDAHERRYTYSLHDMPADMNGWWVTATGRLVVIFSLVAKQPRAASIQP